MTGRYRTGFALSGGFVKGFAHLGALQALAEHDIRPDILAGVSIGSVAAVFTADGREPYRVMELFSTREFRSFSSLTRLHGGIMELDRFLDFMRSNISVARLEKLKLPVIVTATDLDTGQSVHFTEGEIAERVAASCCMPGLFAPIEIDGGHYVDGGVLMNLPVSVLRPLCDKVVAVNLSRIEPDPDERRNVAEVLVRVYNLISHSNIIRDRREADMLIEPAGLGEFGNTELDRGEEIFELGYRETCKVLGQVGHIVFPR